VGDAAVSDLQRVDDRRRPFGSRERWALAVLLLVALVLRLSAVHDYGFQHPHAESPVIDEASYDAWALEIAAGEWVGDEVFFQEPLYPYALATVYAVTDGSRAAARHAQVLLGVLTVFLVLLLARRAFGSCAGWIAGTLLAVHPVAVLLPCLLLKPNLFLPIFAALCLLLAGDTENRRARWLAIGVLGGLGALLRGNLLILLPVLALWPFLRARSLCNWRPAASFALGAVLVLAPVAARNQLVGGVFALTTSGAGTNLYGGNALENPYGVATEFPWVRGVPEHEATDWRLEAERRSGMQLDAGETSRFWTRELFSSLRAEPLAHASILWNKLRLSLGAYEVPDNHDLEWDARYLRVLRAPLPGWGMAGSLGLAGLLAWVVLRRSRSAVERRSGTDLALLFLAYLGTIVLTVTSMRARVPLLVPLLPFAGLFGERCLAAFGSRSRVRGAGLAAALGVAALCVHWPVFGAEVRARDLAERDHNLAVAWLAEGRVRDAAQLADVLARDHPRSARLRTLDASARAEVVFGELESGAPRDEAHAERLNDCLRALRSVYDDGDVSPRERARAAGMAGRIQEGLGQTARAERHVRRAREFQTADVDLLATHARLIVQLLQGAPETADDLDVVADRVLADLARHGDPGGWAPRISEARSRR